MFWGQRDGGCPLRLGAGEGAKTGHFFTMLLITDTTGAVHSQCTTSNSRVAQGGRPPLLALTFPTFPTSWPASLACHKLVSCHCPGYTRPSSSGVDKALMRAGMAGTHLCDLQGAEGCHPRPCAPTPARGSIILLRTGRPGLLHSGPCSCSDSGMTAGNLPIPL